MSINLGEYERVYRITKTVFDSTYYSSDCGDTIDKVNEFWFFRTTEITNKIGI